METRCAARKNPEIAKRSRFNYLKKQPAKIHSNAEALIRLAHYQPPPICAFVCALDSRLDGRLNACAATKLA